jgi:hypothetical protein
MNVEIGAEAALFPEKKYVNGIAVAVQYMYLKHKPICYSAKLFNYNKSSLFCLKRQLVRSSLETLYVTLFEQFQMEPY